MPRSSSKSDPLDSVLIPDPAAEPTTPDLDVEVVDIKPPKESSSGKSKSKSKTKDDPKPKVPDPAPPPPIEKYRVMEMRRLSIKGQWSILKKGKVVSDHTHGPGFIEFLRKAKVELEKVE